MAAKMWLIWADVDDRQVFVGFVRRWQCVSVQVTGDRRLTIGAWNIMKISLSMYFCRKICQVMGNSSNFVCMAQFSVS
jgi:hypothetical protein